MVDDLRTFSLVLARLDYVDVFLLGENGMYRQLPTLHKLDLHLKLFLFNFCAEGGVYFH
jgi:hypothetical protein